jgi:hypothetical protein
MDLNKHDTETISMLVKALNMDKETVTDAYEKAKISASEQFGKLDEVTLAERARNITVAALKGKAFRGANTKFKFICVWNSEPRDNMAKLRDKVMALFQEYKNTDRVQEAIDNKIVKVNKETGEIIALYPKTKDDGTAYATAGQPIPHGVDAYRQLVIGIAAKDDEAKKAVIQAQGKFCSTDLQIGKIYEVEGFIPRTKASDVTMYISTSAKFVEAEDEYLQKGLTKVGLPKICEKVLAEHVVTKQDLQKWFDDQKVPAIFMGFDAFVVVKDANAEYINNQPNNKGNIYVNIDRQITSDSEPYAPNEVSIMCSTKAESTKIDFGKGSIIMVVGTIMLPKPKPGEKANLIITNSKFIGYPGKVTKPVESEPVTTEALGLDEPAKEQPKKTVAKKKTEDEW